MPALRSPDKPDPVPLKVGRRALATAYARRPPTARKPHWAWRMSTVHPTTGARVLVSLGRLAPGGVEDALLAAYRALDPSAVRADGGGLRTLEPLLRAWLYDMEQHGRVAAGPTGPSGPPANGQASGVIESRHCCWPTRPCPPRSTVARRARSATLLWRSSRSSWAKARSRARPGPTGEAD